MSTITTELTARSKAAADFIAEVGWTQFSERNDAGQVCATGAVMYCQPKTGDEQIIIQVLRHRGQAESWNDKAGRTAAEVRAALSADITDAELAEVFGPQWEAIVALVRRAAALTAVEAAASDAAWVAARNAARDAARDAALGAARNAARNAAQDAARSAAWVAARDAAWDAAWVAAWHAVGVAAWALGVRDLIGQHGFTQEHYDTLTGPWRKVIGPVHPDDTTTPENLEEA